MTITTIARLRRDVAMLSERVTPARPPLTPLAVADRAGITPDPWQRDLLRSDARQIIILASRQSGKSTTTAILAAHRAAFVGDSLVLLLSPSLRQSAELYRKVRDILVALGEAAPPATETSALRVALSNGSRIVCLPGKEATIRGFSAPALVIEDEASRVPDDLYMALRPMLATSGGRVILLSTPWGKRGHFFHEWSEGGTGWHRTMVTAEQCPRIDATWLAAERAAIPDFIYRQEYGCAFVETDDHLFRSDDIAAAITPAVTPLFAIGDHDAA